MIGMNFYIRMPGMQVSLNGAQLNGGPAVKRPGSGYKGYSETFLFHKYRQVQRFRDQGSRV
jgi:hypothetical protein